MKPNVTPAIRREVRAMSRERVLDYCYRFMLHVHKCEKVAECHRSMWAKEPEAVLRRRACNFMVYAPQYAAHIA